MEIVAFLGDFAHSLLRSSTLSIFITKVVTGFECACRGLLAHKTTFAMKIDSILVHTYILRNKRKIGIFFLMVSHVFNFSLRKSGFFRMDGFSPREIKL